MRFALIATVALMIGAGCAAGDELIDGPEIVLKTAIRWAGEIPPAGSSAVVDIYRMSEDVGHWALIESDVPYPTDAAGVLVDTMRLDREVPSTGEHVTFRYEVDLTVAGVTYTAEGYPDALVCDSGVWWWYFAGRVYCSETER